MCWAQGARRPALCGNPIRSRSLGMGGSGVDSQRQAERTGGNLRSVAGLAIGLIAGVFCYWMVAKVKAKFGYDDSLDAFGVHGAGGRWGRC